MLIIATFTLFPAFSGVFTNGNNNKCNYPFIVIQFPVEAGKIVPPGDGDRAKKYRRTATSACIENRFRYIFSG